MAVEARLAPIPEQFDLDARVAVSATLALGRTIVTASIGGDDAGHPPEGGGTTPDVSSVPMPGAGSAGGGRFIKGGIEYMAEPPRSPIEGTARYMVNRSTLLPFTSGDRVSTTILRERIDRLREGGGRSAEFLLFSDRIPQGFPGMPVRFAYEERSHRVDLSQDELHLIGDIRPGILTTAYDEAATVTVVENEPGAYHAETIAKAIAMEDFVNRSHILREHGIRAAQILGVCDFAEAGREPWQTFDRLGYITRQEQRIVTLDEYLWGAGFKLGANREQLTRRMVARVANVMAYLHAADVLFAPSPHNILLEPLLPDELILTGFEAAMRISDIATERVVAQVGKAHMRRFISQTMVWENKGYVIAGTAAQLAARFSEIYRERTERGDIVVPSELLLRPDEIIGPRG